MNFNTTKVKLFYYFIVSTLYGTLAFVDIKFAAIVYFLLMVASILFEKNKYFPIIFLLNSTFLVPNWINSYSLWGISFAFIKINFPLIALILLFLRNIGAVYLKRKINLLIVSTDKIITITLLYSILSIIFKHSSETVGGSYTVIFPYLYSLLMISLRNEYNNKDILYILNIFLIALFVEAILFIIMRILQFSPFAEPIEIYGKTSEYVNLYIFQPVGAFGPVEGGVFFIIAMIISYFLYRLTSNYIYTAVLFIFFLALLSTASRLPIFIGLIVIAIIFKNLIKLRTSFFYMPMFFAFLFFLNLINILNKFVSPVVERLSQNPEFDFWQRFEFSVFPVISFIFSNLENFLFGAGYQLFRTLPGGTAAHNIFLAQAADFGVIGLFLMLYLFYSIIKYNNTLNKSEIHKYLKKILNYMIIIWLINGSVQYAAYSFHYYTLLLVLFNLIVSKSYAY